MNFTAASCGVSKQLELFLVQLNVFCTLILNVFPNCCFVAMLSDCADEIAIAPELAAPQLFSDLWTGAQDFSGRDALDNLHYSFWT